MIQFSVDGLLLLIWPQLAETMNSPLLIADVKIFDKAKVGRCPTQNRLPQLLDEWHVTFRKQLLCSADRHRIITDLSTKIAGN